MFEKKKWTRSDPLDLLRKEKNANSKWDSF